MIQQCDGNECIASGGVGLSGSRGPSTTKTKTTKQPELHHRALGQVASSRTMSHVVVAVLGRSG